MSFKAGDMVECIDFRGATGKLFRPKTIYTHRFVLHTREHIEMVEPEMDLDEIHLAQELVK